MGNCSLCKNRRPNFENEYIIKFDTGKHRTIPWKPKNLKMKKVPMRKGPWKVKLDPENLTPRDLFTSPAFDDETFETSRTYISN